MQMGEGDDSESLELTRRERTEREMYSKILLNGQSSCLPVRVWDPGWKRAFLLLNEQDLTCNFP